MSPSSSSVVDSDDLKLTLGRPRQDPLEIDFAPPVHVPVSIPVPLEPDIPFHLPLYGPLELPFEPVPHPDPNAMDLELTLAPFVEAPNPLENQQWDIIKTLTVSDIGNHSRLLIAKNKASHHIMQELSIEDQKQVLRTEGLQIKVLDVDRNREVFLTLKVLPSNHSHILNGSWKKEFVVGRRLEKDNVIGLRYWKQPGDHEGKLLFKILQQH